MAQVCDLCLARDGLIVNDGVRHWNVRCDGIFEDVCLQLHVCESCAKAIGQRLGDVFLEASRPTPRLPSRGAEWFKKLLSPMSRWKPPLGGGVCAYPKIPKACRP